MVEHGALVFIAQRDIDTALVAVFVEKIHCDDVIIRRQIASGNEVRQCVGNYLMANHSPITSIFASSCRLMASAARSHLSIALRCSSSIPSQPSSK